MSEQTKSEPVLFTVVDATCVHPVNGPTVYVDCEWLDCEDAGTYWKKSNGRGLYIQGPMTAHRQEGPGIRGDQDGSAEKPVVFPPL